MRAQTEFNARRNPDTTVDIHLGPTAVPPWTGDLVNFEGEKLYYVIQSVPGPDALVRELTDNVTTYTAPGPIADLEEVVGWSGSGQVTLCGLVKIGNRLKANS